MNIKRIIKEEMDDMDWIRDIQPSIFTKLESATKNHPNIDVITDEHGHFLGIRDAFDMNYFMVSELESHFGTDQDFVADLSKEELLRFIKSNINGSWEFDDPDEDDKDYKDFMELYRLIETL